MFIFAHNLNYFNVFGTISKSVFKFTLTVLLKKEIKYHLIKKAMCHLSLRQNGIVSLTFANFLFQSRLQKATDFIWYWIDCFKCIEY